MTGKGRIIAPQDCGRLEVWHLSMSYGHWSPYCRSEWEPCNFQTFAEVEVTCYRCMQVADAAWNRPFGKPPVRKPKR